MLAPARQCLAHYHGGGVDVGKAAVIDLAAIGEFAHATERSVRQTEIDVFRRASEIALLVPALQRRVIPAEIPVLQHFERRFDGAGEAVARAGAGMFEEGGRVEI